MKWLPVPNSYIHIWLRFYQLVPDHLWSALPSGLYKRPCVQMPLTSCFQDLLEWKARITTSWLHSWKTKQNKVFGSVSSTAFCQLCHESIMLCSRPGKKVSGRLVPMLQPMACKRTARNWAVFAKTRSSNSLLFWCLSIRAVTVPGFGAFALLLYYIVIASYSNCHCHILPVQNDPYDCVKFYCSLWRTFRESQLKWWCSQFTTKVSPEEIHFGYCKKVRLTMMAAFRCSTCFY